MAGYFWVYSFLLQILKFVYSYIRLKCKIILKPFMRLINYIEAFVWT